MTEKTFKIKNKIGIHARPAAQIVKVAAGYRSSIYISKNGNEVNAKSIMGILTLEAGFGSLVTVKCDGDDELDAIEAIEDLIARQKFHEE